MAANHALADFIVNGRKEIPSDNRIRAIYWSFSTENEALLQEDTLFSTIKTCPARFQQAGVQPPAFFIFAPLTPSEFAGRLVSAGVFIIPANGPRLARHDEASIPDYLARLLHINTESFGDISPRPLLRDTDAPEAFLMKKISPAIRKRLDAAEKEFSEQIARTNQRPGWPVGP